MLEKLEKFVILYDFYGPLLTERQQQAIELYYEVDLSLTEVAQQMNISRQGVFDLIKRSEHALEEYEAKLMLANRFQNDRRRIKEALMLIQEANDKPPILLEISALLAQVLETDSFPKGVDRDGF